LQDVEDLLGNMELTTSPVVLAVKLQVKGDQKVVGVAFADASVREIGVSEFIDNDVYSNFEVSPGGVVLMQSLIIQLGVKECVMPSNEKRKDHDLTALYGVVDRCGIVVSEKRPADFTTKDIESDLKRLLGKDNDAPTLRNPLTAFLTQHNSTCKPPWVLPPP
jgi:DNA mismatch repair protein MSH2